MRRVTSETARARKCEVMGWFDRSGRDETRGCRFRCIGRILIGLTHRVEHYEIATVEPHARGLNNLDTRSQRDC